MSFANLTKSAALTAALSAGIFAAPSAALALSGSVSLSGYSDFDSLNINPSADTIDFASVKIREGFDSFALPLSVVNIQSIGLALQGVDDSDNSDGFTAATYAYDAIPGFIQFSNGINFNLDAGTLSRQRQERKVSIFELKTLLSSSLLLGTFSDSTGQSIGSGSLSTSFSKSNFRGDAGSGAFQISLSVIIFSEENENKEVPEPLTGVVGTLIFAIAGARFLHQDQE